VALGMKTYLGLRAKKVGGGASTTPVIVQHRGSPTKINFVTSF